MSTTIFIDQFAENPPNGSGEFRAQLAATFDADARCEWCEDTWEVERATYNKPPPLETRPLPGAYRFTDADGRERVECREHIGCDDTLAVCP